MKQKISKIIPIIVRNTLAFIFGGSLGILTVIIFAEPLLKFAINKDVGLGIIAIAPIMLIMYALAFGTVGGALGIIFYYLYHRRRKP